MQPVHMNPEEAVRAFRDLGGGAHGSVMIPMHWGTFKLTDEAMDEPPVRARAAWEAAGLEPERFWVLAHGETRALGGRGDSLRAPPARSFRRPDGSSPDAFVRTH